MTRTTARVAAARSAGLRLLAALALISSSACSNRPTAPPNLLLVSIDTLRADHLGCYGYERDTSPRLDALAAESIRFKDAFAPAPWTLPSHASMLTGMHPWNIGIDGERRKLPQSTRVVSELLSRAGYRTAAFVDSREEGFVGAGRGFGRGFDHYQHAPHRRDGPRFDVAATVDAALGWLDAEDSDQPFFLFLHTKSVHAVPDDEACLDPRCFPYYKPEPYQFRYVTSDEAPFSWTSPEDGDAQAYLWSLNARILRGELDPRAYPGERTEVLEATYDAGIHYVDLHLGRLLDELRMRGLDGNTAIIVTSDHGEAFLDHSLFLHQEVYDSLLRVPMIVRPPPASTGLTAGRVSSGRVSSGIVSSAPVELADIAPTLLRLAGAEIPRSLTGRPLPLGTTTTGAEDGAKGRDLFAYYLFPGRFSYEGYTLRRGDLKLVVHNPEHPDHFRQELYNTRRDPLELSPLAEPGLQAEMWRALERWRRREPLARGEKLGVPESSTQENLRSLGYLE